MGRLVTNGRQPVQGNIMARLDEVRRGTNKYGQNPSTEKAKPGEGTRRSRKSKRALTMLGA